MKHFFSRVMAVALLLAACTGIAWCDNLTVTVIEKGKASQASTRAGLPSLEKALADYTLSEVDGIVISEGRFEEADWLWLCENSGKIKNVEKFVVTDGIESVAEIPSKPIWGYGHGGEWYFTLFSVAKLKKVREGAFASDQFSKVELPDATEIGPNAFSWCDKLSDISLPNATNIGNSAFLACKSLKSISLPNATEIGSYAFERCKKITDISLPKATKIGIYAFKECGRLTDISLPNATDIGTHAFEGSGLVRVSLPKATDIKLRTFYKCKNLQEVRIPEATKVDSEAFLDCSNLRLVELQKAEAIVRKTFFGLKELQKVLIPSAKKIGTKAFFGCEALEIVSLDEVDEIGPEAFSWCEPLAKVEMPKAQKIGYRAFYSCEKLESLSLPLATEIGNEAFSKCSNLKSAELPEITKIGNKVFLDCALESAVIPKVQEIGNSAFSGCNLKTLSLPVATKIGSDAFRGCDMESVSIPAVKEIGNGAFSYCRQLKSVSLPAVSEIGRGAFYTCEKLTSLNLGATPPSVGGRAFVGCPLTRQLDVINSDGTPLTGEALTEAKKLYKAVDDGEQDDNLWYGWAFDETPASNLSGTIDDVAFAGAASLQEAMKDKDLKEVKKLIITGGTFQVSDWAFLEEKRLGIETFIIENSVDKVANIPALSEGRYLNSPQTISIAKVHEVGSHAFYYCGELTSLSLPDATTIGEEAFKNCTSLSNLELPKAKGIANYAFKGCEKLTSLSLPEATTIGEEAFKMCISLNSISLPEATTIGEEAFKNCTSLSNLELPKAKGIANYAFKGCEKLTSLSLPEATTIGEEAFYGCTNLSNLELPKAKGIANYAFKGCEKLTSLSLPEARTIDASAFYGCTSLTKVALPKATDVSGFGGCTSLTTVELPKAKEIAKVAFYGCEKLTSLSLPEATTIGYEAFQDCTSLTNVELPKAKEIAFRAFYGCEKLTSLSLPEARTIDASAFYGCTNLSNLELPKVKEIGGYAFYGCTNLSNLELPKVKEIGGYAFNGCEKLTDLSLPEATTIGYEAFDGCTSLNSISLPEATEIDANAFLECWSLKSVSLPKAAEIGAYAFSGLDLETLRLGATPPKSNSSNHSFVKCSGTLIITDPDGVPLLGDELAKAADNYDRNDGKPNDGKWYYLKIEKNPPTMLFVKVAPQRGGTVTVTRKFGGKVEQQESLRKGELLVVTASPSSGSLLQGITAVGATSKGNNEWEVTAEPGNPVIFTVTFEAITLGEITITPPNGGTVNITSKDRDVLLTPGDVVTKGEILVVSPNPFRGYTFKELTAVGAISKGNNEWEVTAEPGEQVVFSASFFDAITLGEFKHTPTNVGIIQVRKEGAIAQSGEVRVYPGDALVKGDVLEVWVTDDKAKHTSWCEFKELTAVGATSRYNEKGDLEWVVTAEPGEQVVFSVYYDAITLGESNITPPDGGTVQIYRIENDKKITINAGEVLQKGEIIRAYIQPKEGFTVKESTAIGAYDAYMGEKWEVTAELGEQVAFSISFEGITLGTTTIEPAEGGTVEIKRMKDGTILNQGNALTNEEKLIVTPKPNDGYIPKKITAVGATQVEKSEWKVEAKPGEQVSFSISFEVITLGTTTIEPAEGGTVEIKRMKDGTILNQGNALTNEEKLIVTPKPNDGYIPKKITAVGATQVEKSEWKVEAKPGKQVSFKVEFEKSQNGEGGNNNNNNNDPTPVESALLAQARLFPNPSDGQLTVDVGTTLTRCEVYSNTGVLLQTIESPESLFTIGDCCTHNRLELLYIWLIISIFVS